MVRIGKSGGNYQRPDSLERYTGNPTSARNPADDQAERNATCQNPVILGPDTFPPAYTAPHPGFLGGSRLLSPTSEMASRSTNSVGYCDPSNGYASANLYRHQQAGHDLLVEDDGALRTPWDNPLFDLESPWNLGWQNWPWLNEDAEIEVTF